ncbi:MAG: translation initiation factor IF-2 subunit beta [Candidatus Nanoarchaeia archaeon]
MEYEELLDKAYKEIKPIKVAGRFEIKKVEGHHEGGKTIISNFMQVARSLGRKPEHLARFLFKELAASGELAGDRLILARRISSQQINDKIEKYVKQYVLCPNCKKPDTEIVEEDGKQIMRCLACGNQSRIG